MEDSIKHYSLGGNVRPTRYSLRLEPNFETFEYSGDEKIEAMVGRASKKIVMNAGELKIGRVTVSDSAGIQDGKISIDKKNQRIGIGLKRKVSGKIEISIAFVGHHNDRLYGFYRSKYKIGKEDRYMLTTQFEPANARNAFPCFDEPSFKAVYDLSLVVDKKLDCISNMPIKEEKWISNNKKVVAFGTTPKMSSYLLYMGVGEFRRTIKKYRNIEIGLVTTPGKEKYAGLALEYAASFLEYFEKYFGIRYPLSKLDLIAVPDFSAGAMENWGAITFRETALLGDEKSSVTAKQRIAEVIAHEFVHQWFGDLVTMKWWNDLWLNESFANFMSYKALNAVMPEWEMMLQYIAGVVGAAFAADQLRSTHPISVKVNTPGEIDQIFDEISYNKGGAVLSMLEGYVGSETFRNGLNIYLKNNSYSNAEKYDLWNSIDAAAKGTGRELRVPEVAKSWIDNEGYPSVKVKRTGRWFSLEQGRFMLSDRMNDRTRWLIPIIASYPPGKKETRLLMKDRTARVPAMERRQIKLNSGQTGFYRTIYTEEMLESLGEMIKNVELSGIDAWGVENDMYALTKKRVYTLKDYLGFVDKYCFAARYPLNASVLAHLRGLFGLFYDQDERILGKVSGLLSNYSHEIIKQVGWKRTVDESSTTTLIRSAAILGSGLSGDKMTLNKANKMFRMNDKEDAIDPNLKGAVYSLVAWSGNAKTYKTLQNAYIREELPEEKMKLLASLAMFSDLRILRSSLDFSLSKHVRYQDSYYIPAYASGNPVAKSIIWGWTRKNWKTFMQRFSSGTHMLGRYVDNLAAANDPKTVKEVRGFFGKKQNIRSDIKNSLDEALETMDINYKFIRYNKEAWIEE